MWLQSSSITLLRGGGCFRRGTKLPDRNDQHGHDSEEELSSGYCRDGLFQTAHLDAFPHAAWQGLQPRAGQELGDDDFIEGEDEGEDEACENRRGEERKLDPEDGAVRTGAKRGRCPFKTLVDAVESGGNRQHHEGQNQDRVSKAKREEAANQAHPRIEHVEA